MKIATMVAALRERPPRTNERGNAIHESHWSADRLIIDFAEDFVEGGWAQVDTDQDKSYFGFWVSKSQRITLTYCEGDWSLVVCPDADHFNSELCHAFSFYTEAPFCSVMDFDDGTWTRYFEDRQRHLIGMLA